jgi:hypothetical protein
MDRRENNKKPRATASHMMLRYEPGANPPGINGWLVEGRVVYDAFVLDSKKNGIYVHAESN